MLRAVTRPQRAGFPLRTLRRSSAEAPARGPRDEHDREHDVPKISRGPPPRRCLRYRCVNPYAAPRPARLIDLRSAAGRRLLRLPDHAEHMAGGEVIDRLGSQGASAERPARRRPGPRCSRPPLTSSFSCPRPPDPADEGRELRLIRTCRRPSDSLHDATAYCCQIVSHVEPVRNRNRDQHDLAPDVGDEQDRPAQAVTQTRRAG